MSKGVYVSKALAVSIIVVTVLAVSSIITMLVVYNIQIEKNPPQRPPTNSPTTPFPTGPPPNLRLPGDLVPEKYNVYLQTYFYTRLSNVTNQTFAFNGNATVYFKCLKTTKKIFMHSKDLNITLFRVTDENGDVVAGRLTLWDDESNFLEVELESALKANKNYIFFTTFEGEMFDDLAGLYISKYTENGEDRYLAASQMQPTDARKVFPCFDEPAMKAIFDITIIHRRDTTALSNAKTKESWVTTIDDEQWLVTHFYPTRKMSTYLLAFTVSEFKEEKSDNLVYTFKVRLFADHVFLCPPCTVTDQIALPDFSAGAMENWGLITYRETALLYEEGVSSTSNKEWIVTVIAHEVAHQWFGNLVTMKWWNDLWLNEGFATYISYKGVNKAEASWGINDLFVLHETQPVMQVDSLASSHPLSSGEKDVQTPSDITELFDSITYSKGAAVLRMLSDYLTETVFQKGLKSYLKAYEYSNAEYKDLWSHLQMVKVMKTWTQQMGYPVITINTTSGEVLQQHFLLNQTSHYNFTWQVPIKMVDIAQTCGQMWCLTNSCSSLLTVQKVMYQASGNQWLLANVNCTGYFRVNYNPQNWERLLKQLESNHKNIPVINRGQLIDDAFNLARAKYINTTLALNTTKYLRNETEYIPWESALENLDYFILMFDRSEVYGPMKAYMRKQVYNLYKYFEPYTMNMTVPQGHTEQYNQINAISVACSNDLEDCKETASKLFREWMNNASNKIHPNLKSTIYCNAIAAGGEEEWDFAWQMYMNATIASEKDKLRYALSCTENVWILNRYLSYTLDPSKIRKMDSVSTINYIARNVVGQSLAWDFVRSQWSYISQEYGGGIMSLGSLIDGVTERFSTVFELQQLRQFQKDHGEGSFGSATRALQQAMERTEANIKWVQENKQTVLEWFRRETTNL
uniref:Aminopeptidase n=1 Tax=Scleropages formosus TaxID=113540 RepID=A0A8C9W631_SCLFO